MKWTLKGASAGSVVVIPFVLMFGSPHNNGLSHQLAVLLSLPFQLFAEELTTALGHSELLFDTVFLLLIWGWLFLCLYATRSVFLTAKGIRFHDLLIVLAFLGLPSCYSKTTCDEPVVIHHGERCLYEIRLQALPANGAYTMVQDREHAGGIYLSLQEIALLNREMGVAEW